MKIKTNKSNGGVFFSRKQNQTLRYKNPTELALIYLLEFDSTIVGYWHINKLMPYLPTFDPMARTSLFIVSDFNANQKVVLLENTKALLKTEEKFIKNKIEEFCRFREITLL